MNSEEDIQNKIKYQKKSLENLEKRLQLINDNEIEVGPIGDDGRIIWNKETEQLKTKEKIVKAKKRLQQYQEQIEDYDWIKYYERTPKKVVER